MIKRSDWALIIFVAFTAGLICYLITNNVVAPEGSQGKPTEKVDTTIVFSEKVEEPSEFIYSDENKSKPPINPTLLVVTGYGDDRVKIEDNSTDDNKDTSSEESNSSNREE